MTFKNQLFKIFTLGLIDKDFNEVIIRTLKIPNRDKERAMLLKSVREKKND